MAAWGTDEERYRWQCLQLVLARYCYYVLGHEIMTDSEYDEREDALRRYEEANPAMAHPDSPTRNVGSDIASTYPWSVVDYAERTYGSKKDTP